MSDRRRRQFHIDNDIVEVEFIYDPNTKRWLGNFPVFLETPRYTPNGRPWKNVFETDCDYSNSRFGDCGGCSYFRREEPTDVIAVCYREEMRRQSK